MKTKLLLISLGFAAMAAAQTSHGYVYVAPGALTSGGYNQATLHAGGGGEAIIAKGIGVGAEVGYLGPTAYMGEGFGVFSANGYYHFIHRKDSKLDPFVTGGYTLFFRSGTANLANFGGGVNYWFSRHVGLRAEFRDHLYTGSEHYWGFRFGATFR